MKVSKQYEKKHTGDIVEAVQYTGLNSDKIKYFLEADLEIHTDHVIAYIEKGQLRIKEGDYVVKDGSQIHSLVSPVFHNYYYSIDDQYNTTDTKERSEKDNKYSIHSAEFYTEGPSVMMHVVYRPKQNAVPKEERTIKIPLGNIKDNAPKEINNIINEYLELALNRE